MFSFLPSIPFQATSDSLILLLNIRNMSDAFYLMSPRLFLLSINSYYLLFISSVVPFSFIILVSSTATFFSLLTKCTYCPYSFKTIILYPMLRFWFLVPFSISRNQGFLLEGRVEQWKYNKGLECLEVSQSKKVLKK